MVLLACGHNWHSLSLQDIVSIYSAPSTICDNVVNLAYSTQSLTYRLIRLRMFALKSLESSLCNQGSKIRIPHRGEPSGPKNNAGLVRHLGKCQVNTTLASAGCDPRKLSACLSY